MLSYQIDDANLSAKYVMTVLQTASPAFQLIFAHDAKKVLLSGKMVDAKLSLKSRIDVIRRAYMSKSFRAVSHVQWALSNKEIFVEIVLGMDAFAALLRISVRLVTLVCS